VILHGRDAVRAVEEREGRSLSYAEKRVVMLEGYATEIYPDTKNIPTNGVGQTGQWLHTTFKAAFQHHVERVEQRLPSFDSYPPYLQAELMQCEYRGDLGLSPRAMGYLKDGRFQASATEFLDNAEYKNPKTSSGIKKRLESLHYALMLRSKQDW
jgi:hypothetical protein